MHASSLFADQRFSTFLILLTGGCLVVILVLLNSCSFYLFYIYIYIYIYICYNIYLLYIYSCNLLRRLDWVFLCVCVYVYSQ